MFRSRAADITGRGCEHQIVGMRPHRLMDTIDQIQGALHCRGACDLAWHPDRKEHCVEAAFAHARYVEVAVIVPRSNVEVRIKQQALCSVDVPVDDNCPIVNLSRRSGYLSGNRYANRKRGGETENDKKDSALHCPRRSRNSAMVDSPVIRISVKLDNPTAAKLRAGGLIYIVHSARS